MVEGSSKASGPVGAGVGAVVGLVLAISVIVLTFVGPVLSLAVEAICFRVSGERTVLNTFVSTVVPGLCLLVFLNFWSQKPLALAAANFKDFGQLFLFALVPFVLAIVYAVLVLLLRKYQANVYGIGLLSLAFGAGIFAWSYNAFLPFAFSYYQAYPRVDFTEKPNWIQRRELKNIRSDESRLQAFLQRYSGDYVTALVVLAKAARSRDDYLSRAQYVSKFYPGFELKSLCAGVFEQNSPIDPSAALSVDCRLVLVRGMLHQNFCQNMGLDFYKDFESHLRVLSKQSLADAQRVAASLQSQSSSDWTPDPEKMSQSLKDLIIELGGQEKSAP